MKIISTKRKGEIRYIIVDDNEKVLDDAQGYGYKSVKKAQAAWFYKNRSPQQVKEWENKKNVVKQWINNNSKIIDAFSYELFINLKDGDDEPMEETFERVLHWYLTDQEIQNLPFTIKNFIKIYKKL